ncbi:hypothetical protein FACS1894205_3030 [Alphaproteobacteria bacterium]|nr:hypothetical protein FACS1894205_3030 [Alphaproteobacteria bacterium]
MTEGAVKAAFRRSKSESAFRTISEASEELDIPQHVLRFWESKFTQIRPMKRGGGRRYYRPEDILLLTRIRDLLYKDGFTIKGAQKHLREAGKGGIQPSDLHSPALSDACLAAAEGAVAGEKIENTLVSIDREEFMAILYELRKLRSMLLEAEN